MTIEGRGADEPIAPGHDATSLALNRRVEIAIEGLRVIAAGGLTVKRHARAEADDAPELARNGSRRILASQGRSAGLDVRPGGLTRPSLSMRQTAMSGEAARLDIESLQPALAGFCQRGRGSGHSEHQSRDSAFARRSA